MLTALEPAIGEDILPLAALKARLRIMHDDEDEDLEAMRAQAIDYVERYSGVSLQSRSFQMTDKQFVRAIPLLIGPVVSIDAISYDQSDGTTVDLTEDDWRLSGGHILAAAGTSWPYASGDPGAVRVTFTAGLTNAQEDAPALIAAVCLLAGHLFANREAVNVGNIVSEMPFGVYALADSYRMPGL